MDGSTHRWLEGGSGPVDVVLVHGIPTSPELWRHVAPLIDGAAVYAWEMPGFGASWREGVDRDISVSAQADRLLAWMDAVGLERAVLVGHDLGGGVVQIAAVREPSRCAGLVVTNGIAYDSWPIPEVKATRAAGPVVERLPAALVKAQLRVLVSMGHDDRARARESFEVHARNYDHRDGGRVLIGQMRALRTEDTEAVAPHLPRLDVPAAVVWGAADRFQKVGYGRRLAEDLGATIDEIDGGKHFTPEDHPDRVAGAVRSVVDRVGDARGETR